MENLETLADSYWPLTNETIEAWINRVHPDAPDVLKYLPQATKEFVPNVLEEP
jgi:hypothetical protein